MLKLPSLHFTLLKWKLLELNHKMTMFLAQNNYPDLYHLQGGINYEIDPPQKKNLLNHFYPVPESLQLAARNTI